VSEYSDHLTYDELIGEASSAVIEGWDFSWLDGRAAAEPLPWDYPQLARDALGTATNALDVDTGGGEMLASLAPLPPTIATEAYSANLPVATQRLTPLGVDVREGTGSALPVADDAVDLVLNRHGSLSAAETARVLRPGGVFLTQQVGSRNDVAFNDALGLPPSVDPDAHTLATTVAALEAAGFIVDDAREAFPVTSYFDIGAVVYQLRAIPWQVPGFDPVAFDERLRDLDRHIRRRGPFVVRSHRFLLRARRPDARHA
jgi:SAM-dependent methyltransferase